MATLAPYSAKRTAIACPIPDVPPVTSTFFPFSPRMPSLVASGATAVIGSSLRRWSRCRTVSRRRGALHGGCRRDLGAGAQLRLESAQRGEDCRRRKNRQPEVDEPVEHDAEQRRRERDADHVE